MASLCQMGNVVYPTRGKPKYFLIPFVVHKTVMTKEKLARMLDEHFDEENPMVTGQEDTWVVMMEAEEGTDQRWIEAATECMDFDLNVSSELSEERSDEDSEEILKEESDEPCITVPIVIL